MTEWVLFQACDASKYECITDRLERMHPGAHKGAHNSLRRLFQLHVYLELMDILALRFDESDVAYNSSSNDDNDIDFASVEGFGIYTAL